jgi:hypothetical protein
MSKSNKKQGKEAGKSYSAADMTIPTATIRDRGLGAAFAIAVGKLMDAAASMSGSKNGFLGVAKEEIKPELHESLLPAGHDAKKKLT